MAVTVQTVSTVARAAATDTLTITKPTGLAVGDILLAFCASYDNDGTTRTWNLAAGFTNIQSKPDIINTGTESQSVRVQYKIADSADAAASNFTFTHGATSDLLAGILYRIDGHHATSPINASDGEGKANTATPAFTTAITPSIADCLLLILGSISSGGSSSKTISAFAITTSNPSWTEDFDNHNSTTLTIAGAHATRPETTSTGNYTFTVATGDGTEDSGGIIIAIQPPTNVTISPATINATGAVNAPTVTGGATISPDVVNATGAVNAPTVGQADWSTQDKSDTASWSNLSKT